MKKKILCLTLSLCVAISMFPAVAWADGGDSSYKHSVEELNLAKDNYADKTLENNGFEFKDNTLTIASLEVKETIFVEPNTRIVVKNDSKVGAITASDCATSYAIAGPGKLVVDSLGGLGAEISTLTIAADADVTTSESISLGGSGMVGGFLKVYGKLTYKSKSGTNPTYSISVGKCEIGSEGSLTVEGSDDVGLYFGKKYGDFNDMLVIEQGGKLSVSADRCAVYTERYNSDLDNVPLEDFIKLPPGYLGTKYKLASMDKGDDDGKYAIFIAGAIGGDLTGDMKIAPATEVTLPASSEEKPIVTPSGSRRHTYYDVTAEETANGTIALSGTHVRRGTEVTITAEPAEGCVLKALYLNGEAVEVKSPYTFNIYEDTVVKAEFEKTQEQLIKETNAYNSTIQLIAKSKIAKTAKGKRAIRVYWFEKNGKTLNFDGYEVYRSVKKNKGYGKKPIFTTENTKYLNTAVKKGTRYYYKVRGYKEIGESKLYSNWSTKAWRRAK